VAMDRNKDVANHEAGECDPTHAILRSAAIYDESLGLSGGRRVDATSRFRKNELYVALYESPPFDLKIAAVDVHVSRSTWSMRPWSVRWPRTAVKSMRHAGIRCSSRRLAAMLTG